MDESFDMWSSVKTDYDYAMSFPVWWEKDVQAMVDKDFNHPSVIMYSIGNEIPEAGSSIGSIWGRKISEKIHTLDPTRFTTNSVSFLLTVIKDLPNMMGVGSETRHASDNSEAAGINTTMNNLGDALAAIIDGEICTERTAESFAYVDIAGYNYAESRYLKDIERFPNRIIVGSETFPNKINVNWNFVKEHGQIIGDFTWTGWDYLGEAGIGRVHYDIEGPTHLIQSTYPWISGWCGDIDIIGNRRPVSYYREIVFGLRKAPYIAVQRPEHYSKEVTLSDWSWSDSVSSWSWTGYENKPIKVEVYSDAEEVELLINGRTIGKTDMSEKQDFIAEFDTVYESGEIIAVAYVGGQEVGRMSIHSAKAMSFSKCQPDRTEINASDSDLAFVMISLEDEQGNLYNTADRKVKLMIEGPGHIQGFGSANPVTEENFLMRNIQHSTAKHWLSSVQLAQALSF